MRTRALRGRDEALLDRVAVRDEALLFGRERVALLADADGIDRGPELFERDHPYEPAGLLSGRLILTAWSCAGAVFVESIGST